MKTSKKKVFDAVQMIREIREAMYRKENDPDFREEEFEQIKQKWEKLLELHRKEQEQQAA